MKPIERTLDDILGSIGKRSPDIPGSTASILAGLMGLSMAKMSVLVSSHPTNDPCLYAAVEKIDRLSGDLLQAAEQDRTNFLNYMEVLRDRCAVESEQAYVSALREAESRATVQPLDAARLIVEALEHLNELSSSVDHSVASDLHAGAAILNASFAGIIMAVKINLEPDRMVDLHQHTAETRAELAARRHRIRGPQKCRCATGLPILRPK
jgi:formiminotetrahydrofolate cyclodeaminase